ncbi:unnamed protein product [Rotaria sordida]|nr:unnamed protein product [Rotaria sordida]CAF1583872.1 unnamed protein product [Rotaria sordida]
MGFEAVQLFHKVPTNILDERVYICVLNACAHAGLINEARQICEKIPFNQRTEQIYTTMVDTFSRVFLFDQAQKFIDEFEKSHHPSIPMYMSMLSSARNAKNALLSQKIFDRIQSNFSNVENCITPATVLLANTYALSGNKSMASIIRTKLSQTITKKVVGCSWTVVNRKVFKFRAHDRSHPCSQDIYAELDRLEKELIEHGYKYDESWIARPLNNDETVESVLSGHSERLAIAYNLIQRPTPTRIQVVKNLRVCGDCHTWTKLVAKTRRCLIVVRDANRVHHFYPNGECSCQDHF